MLLDVGIFQSLFVDGQVGRFLFVGMMTPVKEQERHPTVPILIVFNLF
jgi:hypothetical protein